MLLFALSCNILHSAADPSKAEAVRVICTGVINTGQVLIIPEIPSDQRTAGQKIAGVRGLINITIHKKADGSQHTEYTLLYTPKGQNYSSALMLEGSDLQVLQSYQNRPVEIWGTVDHYDQQAGIPVVKVERFEIPFPDLKFQILRGKQSKITLNGQLISLFTTDEGVNYVQTMPGGDLNSPLVENGGGEVLVEALTIPDETISGYPTLRVFSSGMAINPKDGQPIELTITADQPYEVEEAPGMENYVPPAATIEKVELVYYIPDPLYGNPAANPGVTPQYIQPAWRFYGHYSNGDEFEFLVQALKQEFLLPELAPYQGPG